VELYIAENKKQKEICEKYNAKYFEIYENYEAEMKLVYDWIDSELTNKLAVSI